ncbi:hypothetical protein JTE90_027560 [Oedothorax gibbosus]|uniref:Uncharacterized protein n=1 Tax=Oedothorax gibbosus TaxID=931172 RepID=A0AAV6VM07_9ARAC|nr:hypothetical protein JTE90_027560 [Oedothorax gibbosus]
MDRQLLSLIILTHSSDVLENSFALLSNDNYEVAMKSVLGFMLRLRRWKTLCGQCLLHSLNYCLIGG